MGSAGVAVGGADERDAHTALAQMRKHSRMKQLIVWMSQRDQKRSRSSHESLRSSRTQNQNLEPGTARTQNPQNLRTLRTPEPLEPREPEPLAIQCERKRRILSSATMRGRAT